MWHHCHCHIIICCSRNTAISKQTSLLFFFWHHYYREKQKNPNPRRAPKHFSPWIWLLSVTTAGNAVGVFLACLYLCVLVFTRFSTKNKTPASLVSPVELIILDHFILLTEGRDRLGVMNGHCYTLPDHPGAHPGTQPDGNQVAWLMWYLTKDRSRSSPSVIRKSLLSTCSNTAVLLLPLKKMCGNKKCSRLPYYCIYTIKKEN